MTTTWLLVLPSGYSAFKTPASRGRRTHRLRSSGRSLSGSPALEYLLIGTFLAAGFPLDGGEGSLSSAASVGYPELCELPGRRWDLRAGVRANRERLTKTAQALALRLWLWPLLSPAGRLQYGSILTLGRRSAACRPLVRACWLPAT